MRFQPRSLDLMKISLGISIRTDDTYLRNTRNTYLIGWVQLGLPRKKKTSVSASPPSAGAVELTLSSCILVNL